MSKKASIPTIFGPLASQQADQLAQKVWDNTELRMGLYGKKVKSLPDAHKALIEKMDKLLPSIKKGTKMLILGAGYGNTARAIADKYNCKIDALNKDALQNAYHEEQNAAAELEDYIQVIEGGLDQIPFAGDGYDIIWAHDALLFAEDKIRLFRSITRALKPEGRFIFTAVMEKDLNFGAGLEDLLATLEIEELTSLAIYKRMANQADLEQVYIREWPEHLLTHFSHLQEQLKNSKVKPTKALPKKVLEQAEQSLELWHQAAKEELLNWGILQFQKRNV